MSNNYKRECPHLYRGQVINNNDPKNLGKCKIRVPAVHGELTSPDSVLPWARPLVLSPVAKGRGSVNIPRVGDIVWVLFEGADKDYPVYLGGTYAIDELSIDKDRIDFYIENSLAISYMRETNEYIVSVGNNSISISDNGISLRGNVNIEGDLTVTGSISPSCDCKEGEQ